MTEPVSFTLEIKDDYAHDYDESPSYVALTVGQADLDTIDIEVTDESGDKKSVTVSYNAFYNAVDALDDARRACFRVDKKQHYEPDSD